MYREIAIMLFRKYYYDRKYNNIMLNGVK